MLRANLLSVELDPPLDLAGFHHRGTSVTERLGTARFGAGVYVAEAGRPIWPYHYHHGVEEWLLVLAGSPVLREPAGRRTLSVGDLICFPSGPEGAHTVAGPGRFVIFSTGQERGPWESVYPDSHKTSVGEGLLPLDTVVGYWYREGSGEIDAEPGRREPTLLTAPPRPLVNVHAVDVAPLFDDIPAGFRSRGAMLGPALDAERIGATVLECDPGEGSAPYHYEWGREEWMLVLVGAPTLRHPGGEDPLAAGDLVCFPEGPTGAHRLLNRSDELMRVMLFSTKGLPSNVCYPDSGKWFLRNGPDAPGPLLRESDAVGYWDGEL